MRTVNVHEAKTQLSRLIDQAARGEPFIIAKAGRPMVRVAGLEPVADTGRLGFLQGHISVPDDFDRMHSDEIVQMFSAP